MKVRSDRTVEADETLFNLICAINATIVDRQGVGTILNAD